MTSDATRPARVCAALLAAVEASEGRTRARKRDQTADTLGLEIKRALLRDVVREDPDEAAFEQWLLDYSERSPTPGATLAMARAVRDEWSLAVRVKDFAAWLDCGAPSEDARSRGEREV